MQLSDDACILLANKTIYSSNFSNSTPIEESHSNNRCYQSDNMFFKFSPNTEALQYEYNCYQQIFDSPYFPGPYAFVTSSDGALLVTERLDGYSDIDKYWSIMNQKQKILFAEGCISQLKYIHSVDVGYIKRSSRRKEELLSIKDTIIANPYIKSDEISLYIKERINIDAKLKDGSYCILHNDFWFKNFLHKKGKLIGIIDFEQGFLGPASIDGYKILEHDFYARQTNNTNEEDIMKMIINIAKKSYPELFDSDPRIERYVYLRTRLQSLSQWDTKEYDHQNTQDFFANFL